MKIQVWVVRDSHCGNGRDDPGHVLAVLPSPQNAQAWIDDPRNKWEGDVDIEGPFDLMTEDVRP